MDESQFGSSASRKQREQDEVDAYIREVREHFETVPHFRFEEYVSRGGYGVTALISQQGFGLRRGRKLIVKRAINNSARELRKEIRIMQKLNGSAHIARVVASKDDTDVAQGWRQLSPLRRLTDRIRGSPPPDLLAGLAGPTLILEYLENGSLNRLRERVIQARASVPNRVLWSIFLCLIRSCVAMSYPPDAPPGSEPGLEEIPQNPPDDAPRGYIHADMHPGNIIVGSLRDFPDHSRVPVVKLIDFGLALESGASAPRNILDASKNILWLITHRVDIIGPHREVYKGIETMAYPLLPDDITGEEPYPSLDLDLRDLLVKCMAGDRDVRPTLAGVFGIAKRAVQERNAQFYGPRGALESDEAVRQFVQQFIYDAD
ncbi:kinase-like domain-containing protein [Xylaria grammica]|nr:kinase-like domain-containing protein [Xylaria grammica]